MLPYLLSFEPRSIPTIQLELHFDIIDENLSSASVSFFWFFCCNIASLFNHLFQEINPLPEVVRIHIDNEVAGFAIEFINILCMVDEFHSFIKIFSSILLQMSIVILLCLNHPCGNCILWAPF